MIMFVKLMTLNIFVNCLIIQTVVKLTINME